MDDALRNRLWNLLESTYITWVQREVFRSSSKVHPKIYDFITKLMDEHLKIEMQYDYFNSVKFEEFIRKYFFSSEWFEVYDLIEFFVKYYNPQRMRQSFTKQCNSILEQERSGYRFVGDTITPITSEVEITDIEKALDSPFKPVNEHMKKALELLSKRESPDYPNSIKESISAVESICNLISGERKSLGSCLDKIEREDKIPIHGALREAFVHLYGYSSAEDGIRHASIKDSEVDFDIAKFMLVSCSAFINYLVSKVSRTGISI